MRREPRRALVVRPFSLDEREVPVDRHLWVLAEEGDDVVVEYKDRTGRVSRDCLVSSPVPAPTVEALRTIDPCFGSPGDAFETEYESPEDYFRIVRCRAHGQRFLSAVRGTVDLYDRLTLLSSDDVGSPDDIWRRYNALSDDWLNYAGRSL